MNLSYSGKLTKAEYLKVVKLNTREILKKGGFHFDLWVLLIGIGALLFLLSVGAFRQWNLSQSNSFPWFMIGYIAGVFVIVLGWKLRAVPSKFWDENQDMLSKVEGRISDDAIVPFIQNGNLKINWSEFNGYGEYQGIIVLFRPPSSVMPFIERFFENQEDWVSFRNMVIEKLPLTHRVNQISLPKVKVSNLPVYILFILSIIIMIIYNFLYND